jgi:hypothetical protein
MNINEVIKSLSPLNYFILFQISTHPFRHKENRHDYDGRKEFLAPELYKSDMEKSKRENAPRMFFGGSIKFLTVGF